MDIGLLLERKILALGEPGNILATSKNYEGFIDVLRIHRIHNKISYSKMAIDCDMEKKTLYGWINHDRAPKLQTICPVFENLGYELILRRKCSDGNNE